MTLATPDPLRCPSCNHHIHHPQPCAWTFGAGTYEVPCECPPDPLRESLRGILIRAAVEGSSQGVLPVATRRAFDAALDAYAAAVVRIAQPVPALDVERLTEAMRYGIERQLGQGSAITFDVAIGAAVARYALA